MSKYIIELGEDANMVQVISVTQSGNAYIDSTVYVGYLEQLNSDYINEHYGELQDTAYKKGFEDGQNQNEAWKYARKIACVPQNGGMDRAWLDAIFGSALDRSEILFTFSAKNAIEKIKAYEKKQSDKIEVGDEVEWDNDFTGDRFIVTRIYQPYGKKEQCDGIDDDGDVYRAVLIESLVKTGRHFDIASILEDMKHD